ncbi:thioredoxin domain-containing protein [Flavobacterium microcysteis]|uniref:Uncharacterized protein n=1 Tax=Flavobacterium microcysteis TaxID=2596891 RepID=A0A501Q0J0_9FLAO|nr:hypothetical protein [Flavobacterium microcysteis]TPD65536.1 hypothetical protein FJA49_15180 [Flavobacterium microcysteis]
MRTKKNSLNKGLSLKWVFPFLAIFFFSMDANAQCAMCRAVLETEEGGIKAEAVNDGIVYLMVIPYILVGILGFAIYKMKTKKKPE